ncbi:hypothetical protein DEJ51_34275 [Streptomyces venezuelae]|uniref:Uncharacterized protein n=1 Tax=Streptomyces venezuelae TaxID=54571 RepID=A0A5P2DUJ6_STRVZ|nr:hypothetical protein [Streptomyces venezuelae]QES58573.1 hypothetical protein DEJ51_34275 [Streptomyces venezuelae]
MPSPTADTDRGACGRFADHLSFTTPDREPQSEEFAPGPLTGLPSAGAPGPAGMAACNCLRAQLPEATGEQAD